uniref:Uncharacterized protein n=1 Tax=Hemiselmis andersenii TaxID=464988 RepID=A0A6U2J6A5_HEMAN
MFDYCMPYILLPHKREGEVADTSVDVMVELPGRQAPVVCEFDWEMDEVDEFVDEKMQEEELDAKHREALAKGVRDAVTAAKQARKEKKLAQKAEVDAIPPAVRKALEAIKVHKFYPKNELCKGMRSKYVNRYYGQADQIEGDA